MQAEVAAFLEADFLEPDIYFDQAMEYFNEGRMTDASESIHEAVDFIRTLTLQEDTLHTQLLYVASTELTQLSEEVGAGNITNSQVLYQVFTQVNLAIVAYQLTIVEEFYWMGGDKKEGLERLFQALLRIEYAMYYNDFELSSGDESRLENLRMEILKAQRSSPELWKKIDKLIRDMNVSNDSH